MIVQLPEWYLCEMKFTIKTFGIVRDILGGREVLLDINGATVGDLRRYLSSRHPGLNDLNSLFIAVNQNYAGDHTELKETDEIAIIPPVSGG
jgi:molybdopterin converting factor subunit 1